MESSLWLLLVLITLAIIHIVQAQDQQGIRFLICPIYILSTSSTNVLLLRSALVLMVNVDYVC